MLAGQDGRVALHDPNVLLAVTGAGLCLLLLLVLALSGGRRTTDTELQRASSFFTDDTGTRGMLLILQRLLPAAEQWRRPLTHLAPPGATTAATLLVFAPHEPLTTAQAEALDTWMARGGQTIMVSQRDWPVRASRPQHAEAGDAADDSQDDEPEGYLQRHGFRLAERLEQEALTGLHTLQLGAFQVQWEADSRAHAALVTAGPHVLVGSKRIGRGRLIVVPDDSAFANRRLRTSQNAIWLVTTCAAWGSGRVLIDEFHQGFGRRRGLLALLGQFMTTPWGWVCVQAAAAGLVYVFGTLRRFGRPYDPPPPLLRPVDLVEARGALFAAARARRLAAELLHQHLQYRLATRLGYAVHLAEAQTCQRLLQHAPSLRRELEHYQALSHKARYGAGISAGELVTLGQLAARLHEECTTV